MTTTKVQPHTTADLFIPVRECTPWCEVRDHSNEHPDDRSCWSTFQVVPLSKHKPSEYTDGIWRQAYLNVYLRREVGEDDATVLIHSEETDKELRLTRPEAITLLGVLTELIATAEGSS